ncbi:hypothetical protein KY290_000654 [Solanum tuberosum]|uniref:Uncharacterized protein n=1 Tax=Solanum tuberosum TaxID=4113 RepID=A0ABQ7WJY3_SOLTU|nr:hypothetical protein KY289_000718 [Solanum tuberosum]KAH0764773.1 hypothetical protein KY285_000644 [Solanum tuberosum]KAH0781056.1 hypothetical protein KY290_000654 [Solanum tuberosum]
MYGDMENGKHLNPWGGLWRSIIETRMFMGKIHFKHKGCVESHIYNVKAKKQIMSLFYLQGF